MRFSSLTLLFMLFFLLCGTPLHLHTPVDLSPQLAMADDPPFEDDPFAEDEASIAVADPLEPLNRGFFWVNDKLYFYLLKPVARGWRIVPEPARVSIDNLFENWLFPKRFVNNALQGKANGAATESGRFFVNTTLGVLGLFDPAKNWFGLEAYKEDTGQTLGSWGLGHGLYLVLPVFGPSSVRDGVGLIGDRFLDPLTYVDIHSYERIGLKVTDQVNYLSIDNDTYEAIKKDALDPYRFIRNGYIQRRAQQVAQ